MNPLQQSWRTRALALEASLNRLIEEIHSTSLSFTREDRQVLEARLEVLMAELEEVILRDPNEPREARERRITSVRGSADALALLQAKIARRERDLRREGEDLTHERRELDLEQVKREFDSELGEA